MKSIVKSVTVVGQVLGLLVGNKLTTPVTAAIEQNPFIALF